MMNTDIDHWKTTLPYGGDFTTFKALRLNLLISTTNNPPKKKSFGRIPTNSPSISPQIHRTPPGKTRTRTPKTQACVADQTIESSYSTLPSQCRLHHRPGIGPECIWPGPSGSRWVHRKDPTSDEDGQDGQVFMPQSPCRRVHHLKVLPLCHRRTCIPDFRAPGP